MKNGILIFNAILLVLVGILYYLNFSSSSKKTTLPKENTVKASSPNSQFTIAYFEMDSLENSFAMVKDVKNELSRKEEAINNELSRMEKTYRDKAAGYQRQAATMNQVQSETATKDMMQMQQQMQGKKQALDQEYQEFYMRKMKDVKTKIEDFLKEFNKDKQYSYIFAYEPGLFYYTDTLYNITGPVVKGLNERYSQKNR
ncbi:MAG: OmpH family outer membrane protein [Chitinophagaceae bacterium]